MARKKVDSKNSLLVILVLAVIVLVACTLLISRSLQSDTLTMGSKADFAIDVEIMPNGTQCTKIRGCGQFCGKIAACADEQTITCAKKYSPDLNKVPSIRDLKCTEGSNRDLVCTFDKDCREIDWGSIVMAACGCTTISPTLVLSTYPTLDPTQRWKIMVSPTPPNY